MISLAWFGARREHRVHRICVIPRGATLVVLLHHRGRIARSSSTTFWWGRNPVIGLQGPGGLRSKRGSSRHRRLPDATTSTTFMRERFPLNGLHTGMWTISVHYLHQHSIGLGFGSPRSRKFCVFCPIPQQWYQSKAMRRCIVRIEHKIKHATYRKFNLRQNKSSRKTKALQLNRPAAKKRKRTTHS